MYTYLEVFYTLKAVKFSVHNYIDWYLFSFCFYLGNLPELPSKANIVPQK